MATSPATNQPVEVTEAQAALTEFERAFVFSGTRCEFNRAARMVLPLVNQCVYHPLLDVCECADLEVWKVSGEGRSWFYGVCHLHRLQPLGRAIREQRSSDADRGHRSRKSGGSTERWYSLRGK